MRNPLVPIGIALMLLLTSCSNNITHINNDVIPIPAGYSFFTASSFGRIGFTTLYIKDNKDGSIYEYKDEKIGRKITPPKGYEIVAITQFGDWGLKGFFCKKIASGAISRCD